MAEMWIKRNLWRLGIVAVILALASLFTSTVWGQPIPQLQRYKEGAKTTTMVIGEQGQVVDEFTTIDPKGKKNHNTLEFKIGGAKMEGIRMTNVNMKPGGAGTVRFEISAALGFSILTGNLDLTDSRFASLAVKNSECRQIDLRGVLADGASNPITAASPMLPHRSFSSFEALPVWKVDATKYDVVMITAAANAEVGFIEIDNVGVPGDATIERVKANKCSFKGSTIGRGDGSSTKEFVFDNVKANGPAIGNVDESAGIDNTR
ncbi:MAG: hypothetical protein WAP23_00105 [Candidatus Spechtbacterales bacterium]